MRPTGGWRRLAVGRRPATRLAPEVRLLLAAAFVSDTGGGLTFPFLLIYLHDVRHIALAPAGLLIGAASLAGLPAGPVAGAIVDRIGPRLVAMGCLFIQAVGTAALTFVRGPASAVAPVAIFGLGQGAAWPAWFAILGAASHDEESRPKLFALSFQLLNLGLGVGSVIGGLVVHVGDASTFDTVYLVNAAATLVLVGVLALLPAKTFGRRGSVVQPEPVSADPLPAAPTVAAVLPQPTAPLEAPPPTGGYRQMFSEVRMRRLLAGLTVLALGGYGALNTGFVGFATTVVHVTPRTISLAFAANTGFIVIAQPLGLRLAGAMRRTTALSIVAAFFGASWAVLALSGLAPGSTTGDALCIVTLVVFAAGEVLLSPVQAPLANDLAPARSSGRYNAAVASIYSVTSVICPMFAGAMLNASLGNWLLLLFLIACALSVFCFRRLRRSLTAAQDHADVAT